MRANYKIVKGFLTPQECAELRGWAQLKPGQTATVGHGSTNRVSDIRSSIVRWLDRGDSEIIPLMEKLKAATLRANADLFGVDYHDFLDVQFTEYHSSQTGHYDWHEDNCWFPAVDRQTPWDRKLSVVVALSNPKEYEGGKLELCNVEKHDFGAQGDLIIFPSLLRHRVTPVTSGVRYTLVSWAVGPRWK